MARIQTDVGAFAAGEQQDEEVDAGDHVREEGCQTRARRAHVQAPGEDEDGIEHDVEQAAGHGADACVERRAHGAHQIGQHHIEDAGRSAAAHRPEQIGGCCAGGLRVRAQQAQKRHSENDAEQREQQGAGQRAVEAEGGAAAHGVVVLPAQRAAHHAGGAYAEEVVHGVERQQHRRGQRHRRVLHGIVQHAHEVSVRQVVDHHHQRAENGGNRHAQHRPGNGHALKELYSRPVFHISLLLYWQHSGGGRCILRRASCYGPYFFFLPPLLPDFFAAFCSAFIWRTDSSV